MLKHYRLSHPEYQAMLKRSGGKCEICRKAPGERGLRVDHCHRTGVPRGLLCNPCNLGLGYVEREPGWVDRAQGYLAQAVICG